MEKIGRAKQNAQAQTPPEGYPPNGSDVEGEYTHTIPPIQSPSDTDSSASCKVANSDNEENQGVSESGGNVATSEGVGVGENMGEVVDVDYREGPPSGNGSPVDGEVGVKNDA